jgi:sugar phosphate isomerase/epimerase
MPQDLSRLAIHQATTETRWGLREAIPGYARHGVRGITVRRDKLAACGVAEARRLLRDHGMAVSGLSRFHPSSASDPAVRRASLDEGRRAVDEAAELGARFLTMIGEGPCGDGSRDLEGARRRVRDALADLLPYARAAGVPLAIEPVHPMNADACCINTLAQANDLAGELGEGTGVLVDVYHVWWDPEIEAQVRRAAGRILGFHMSDWLVPTRDVALDRGMMGDGVIDIPRLRRLVDEAGYGGFHEVEIISADDWWRRDPDEVVRTCVERYGSAC